jgi:tudor domain-containing protein 3
VSTAERHIQDTSRDEELARQLQEQLDLEDSHVSFHFHLISLSFKRASSNNSLTDIILPWQCDTFQRIPVTSEAERLRMNMFSFNGPEEMDGGGRRDFRGRGRGRVRGQGRGRGRGRGRF